jgi:hypothetical protein
MSLRYIGLCAFVGFMCLVLIGMVIGPGVKRKYQEIRKGLDHAIEQVAR